MIRAVAKQHETGKSGTDKKARNPGGGTTTHRPVTPKVTPKVTSKPSTKKK